MIIIAKIYFNQMYIVYILSFIHFGENTNYLPTYKN